MITVLTTGSVAMLEMVGSRVLLAQTQKRHQQKEEKRKKHDPMGRGSCGSARRIGGCTKTLSLPALITINLSVLSLSLPHNYNIIIIS